VFLYQWQEGKRIGCGQLIRVIKHGEHWNAPERHPELGSDEIHIWRANLAELASAGDLEILDDDERERSARFVKPEHGSRYATAQALLRRMLSAYTGRSVQDIAYRRGPNGKPYLLDSSLEFNITHSGDLLLAAVTLGREVGIDIEHVRPERPVMSLAKRYYTPAEVAWIGTLQKEEQARAFFRLWTLKESFLKARGTGLPGGLNTFEYALVDEDEPRLLWTHPPHGKPEDWSSWELTAHPDYTAAMVVSGPARTISAYEWK